MSHQADYDSLFVPHEYTGTNESLRGIKISGVKDFSFDMNQGFDQGLKVNISGEVEGIKIEGDLSDRAVPAQTMRIGDIEKMSLRAATKNFHAGLGNLTLPLPFGIEDEIQGGRFGIYNQTQESNINVSYAINRGLYKRLEFNGEEGKQSPYFLEGKIITGTEKVYLAQGIGLPGLLKRDEDYYLDYEQSILSFTNKNIITNRSRIVIEYESATEDYPNIYEETDGRMKIGNWTFNTLYRRGRDDKNSPLNFLLSPAEIESLKNCGDSLRFFHTYFDTSSTGSYEIQDNHFVYVGEGQGSYDVIFFYVGENLGEYIYDPNIKGFSYEGSTLGNYSPKKFIPLPKDEQFYGLGINAGNELGITLYGSKFDNNSYSPFDDNDNYGKGCKLTLQKRSRIFSLNSEYLNYERNLNLPRAKEEVGYYYDWNTTDTLKEMGRFGLGVNLTENFGLDLGYGILNRKHHRKSAVFRPLFCYFGYEKIDTLDKLFCGLEKSLNRYSLNGRYEKYENSHYANYGFRYAPAKQSVGVSGEYDKSYQNQGITTRLDFSSTPFSLFLGHRLYNDTTFLFGNASLNIFYQGISFIGNLQQTQSYSQKKDETYLKVKEGTGNYVYDTITNSYIAKQGGDYIKRVILLKSFQRVVTRNYGVETGYSKGFFDLKGRFNYLNEENFLLHGEAIMFLFNSDDYDFEMDLRQEISNDARYVFEPDFSRERAFSFNPAYKKLHNRSEIKEKIAKAGELLREIRNDYSEEISYEIFRQPSLLPYSGYSYSRIYSGYFEALNIRLHTPKWGIIFVQPIKRRGRLEVNVELIYRSYNISDVPYFFRANEPPGLTKTVGINIGIGMGENTVFSLIYRIQFPPAEKFTQNLRFQTRIKF